MPELIREFTNFTPGELTYHESVPGGEITAQEMKNLRVDTHGALRQRQSIRATLPPNSHNITGIAASTDLLFFINSNEQLFYRNQERTDQKDIEIPIRGRPRIITDTNPAGSIEATKLSGRISIIYEYENFIILTSEGQDQGYWIHLTADETIDTVRRAVIRRSENDFSDFGIGEVFSGIVINHVRELHIAFPDDSTDIWHFAALKNGDQIVCTPADGGSDVIFKLNAEPTPLFGQTPPVTTYLRIPNDRYSQVGTLEDGVVYTVKAVTLGPGLIAYPLGFNPPTFTVTPTLAPNKTGGVDATKTHFYRFTYVRDLRTLQQEAYQIGKFGTVTGEDITEEPFKDVESNPSPAISTRGIPASAADTARVMLLEGIKFPNPDGLEAGIAVYRSRPILNTELDDKSVTLDDEDLDFRRVGVYPPLRDLAANPGAVPPEREQDARFDDDMSEENRAKQVALRFDNDRMPPAKTFTVFNDRVFVPNKTELRYSDLRFGNLVLWAYPKTNSIRRPVDFTFATAYRDLLIFGGRNGMWRMVGNSPSNFDIDRITNLGPIDPYAITTTEDTIGYITTAALHISDGISTQDISEPIQAYFENQEPIRGSVLFLPNGNTVWSVVFAKIDGSLNRQTFVRARQWQQWSDLEIEQNARFEQVSVTGDTETIAAIAENTPHIRQVLWENLTGIYDGRTTEISELTPIQWSWKSQKLDFQAEGIAAERKRFTELIIEGKADTEIDGELAQLNVTFLIYDTNNDVITVTAQRTLDRPHLYKTRVPIRKIGQAIEFTVEGRGNVDIRSFCLKGNI